MRDRCPGQYTLDLKGFSNLRDDVELMVKNCEDFNNGPDEKAVRKDAKRMGTKAKKIFEEDLEKVQQAAAARDKKLQTLSAS